jgi:hypothetical protein
MPWAEIIGRDAGREDRFALRQRYAVPVLIHFREFLERERARVLPESPEAMAIAYALSNWTALRRYTVDGDLAIGNNGPSGVCAASQPDAGTGRFSVAAAVERPLRC